MSLKLYCNEKVPVAAPFENFMLIPNYDHLWDINFERKDDSFFPQIMEFVRSLSILKGKIDHQVNIFQYIKWKYIDITRSKLRKNLFYD